jgi:hypothetical protein
MAPPYTDTRLNSKAYEYFRKFTGTFTGAALLAGPSTQPLISALARMVPD